MVAFDVQYVVQSPAKVPGTRGLSVAIVAATLFFALLVGLVVLGQASVVVLAPYAFFSAASFMMYREDKLAAMTRTWRVPESNLHFAALVGGWPGALVARRVFHHKTTKQPFRTIFWLTVVANCSALGVLVYDTPLGGG
jgi:uncharacterized membrane protein YsdA (DUF1294 family)